MATKNIKLTKSVISNSYSNNIHSKEFNKLAKSDESIDEQKILDTYNSFFKFYILFGHYLITLK